MFTIAGLIIYKWVLALFPTRRSVLAGNPCLEIHVFSYSRGAGKTAVVEALVSRLNSIGIPVYVIKHVHHGSPDLLWGKDAERAFAAGARVSVAYGSEYSVILARINADPFSLVTALSQIAGDMYVLLIEGFRGMKRGVPVLVVRSRDELNRRDCEELSRTGGFIVSLAVDLIKPLEGCRVYSVREFLDNVAEMATKSCLSRGTP